MYKKLTDVLAQKDSSEKKALGRVDGFDPDKATDETDESIEALGHFLAS